MFVWFVYNWVNTEYKYIEPRCHNYNKNLGAVVIKLLVLILYSYLTREKSQISLHVLIKKVRKF